MESGKHFIRLPKEGNIIVHIYICIMNVYFFDSLCCVYSLTAFIRYMRPFDFSKLFNNVFVMFLIMRFL